MAKKENDVSGIVRYAIDLIGAKVWRNNVGYDHAKKMAYGLKKGSADWIGVMPITIQPHHVGKKIGVFLSVEMKAETDAEEDQEKWLKDRREDGCIAVIARKATAADEIKNWEFPDA